MTSVIFLNGCLCFGVTADDRQGARQRRPSGCGERRSVFWLAASRSDGSAAVLQSSG